MPSSEAAYGGNSGDQFRLRLETSLLSQEVSNNRSRVRIRAYMRESGSSSAWNDFNTSGYTEFNGGNRANHTMPSWGLGSGPWYLVSARDVWIAHNSDGSKTANFTAYHNADNGSIVSSASTSHNYTLPTIARYADITSWSLGATTETSIRVSVSTNRTADLVDYSVNGGAWTRGYTGNFTSRSFTINNLNPATAYSVKIRVRADASGLYRTSGIKSATTNAVTITSLSVPSATDTSLNIIATTSHLADQLQYRVQGETTWITSNGDFTSKQVTLSGLTANINYTVEARARHKDSAQYTPIATTTGTTQFPQPLQPDNLVPASGIGVASLRPSLSWRYNATSPDSQSAYQVIVRRESDSVTIWDSGKVISGSTSATLPSDLAWGVGYQWQVKTWSGSNIEGAYSELASFVTSQAPVVTITSPVSGSTSTTDAPTIEWSYSDPEGTAQTSYRVEVSTTDGATIYSEELSGDATSHAIPSGYMTNGSTYNVQIFAKDSTGVEGVSSNVEVSIEFIGPPTPIVNTELSADKLFTRIELTSTNPVDNSFEGDRIRVLKRESGVQEWSRVGEVIPLIQNIHSFDSTDQWVAATGTPTVALATESHYRQGENALSFMSSSNGNHRLDAQTSITIPKPKTFRIWVYIASGTPVTFLSFKIGNDSSRYWSNGFFTSGIPTDTWTSIEWDFSDMTTVAPSTDNRPSHDEPITWSQIQFNSTAAVPQNSLLFDGWRVVGEDGVSIYDYELANGKTYEYAAQSINTRQNLEGAISQPTDPVAIKYLQFLNTFIIPVYAQSEAVVSFMDISESPSWATTTDTAYFMPKGARLPIVFSDGTQKYKAGSMVLHFYDECFDGEGMTGVNKLESIMNEKPLMIRTYWGDIFYVSIDGQISVTRLEDVGWVVGFSFTEIESY